MAKRSCFGRAVFLCPAGDKPPIDFVGQCVILKKADRPVGRETATVCPKRKNMRETKKYHDITL